MKEIIISMKGKGILEFLELAARIGQIENSIERTKIGEFEVKLHLIKKKVF